MLKPSRATDQGVLSAIHLRQRISLYRGLRPHDHPGDGTLVTRCESVKFIMKYVPLHNLNELYYLHSSQLKQSYLHQRAFFVVCLAYRKSKCVDIFHQWSLQALNKLNNALLHPVHESSQVIRWNFSVGLKVIQGQQWWERP